MPEGSTAVDGATARGGGSTRRHGLRGIVGATGRYVDVALAAAVVALVVVMVVPVPPMLLDLLLAASFTAAVTLVGLAIIAPDPLRVSVFPALLLLTTLFRLALNISSTRLILSDAYAGEVIAAFGSFVVAGSVVVGAAIFSLLTIVQYVVVAKGAERVAEVGARFALDATPGRQLSIEADLRAGAIDAAEAARRRDSLRREGHLYGAMDGAMKFVKGDAIAGMLIIAVNIGAGLAIGVAQKGLPLGEAIQIYTVLTVGDGLVTQLPSLMVSVAAGIVVTRVAGSAGGGAFGQDIAVQVLARPRALAVGAGLAIALGLLPGLPAGPFLVVGVILGGIALAAAQAAARRESRARRPEVPTRPSPVRLELAPDLLAAVAGVDPDGALLGVEVPRVRQQIADRLGLRVPPVEVVAAAPDAPPGSFSVVLGGVPAARGVASGRERAAEAVADALESALVANTDVMLGLQEVGRMLEALSATHPALVAAVVPARISTASLAGALRLLAAEGIPVGDLPAILEALAVGAKAPLEPELLSERIRGGLRRQITHHVLGERRAARVIVLSAELEKLLADAAAPGAVASPRTFPIPSDLRDEVRSAAQRLTRSVVGSDPRPLIFLVPREVRLALRGLLGPTTRGLPVMAREDLDDDVALEPVGTLGP